MIGGLTYTNRLCRQLTGKGKKKQRLSGKPRADNWREKFKTVSKMTLVALTKWSTKGSEYPGFFYAELRRTTRVHCSQGTKGNSIAMLR